jgi:hypothetical protein
MVLTAVYVTAGAIDSFEDIALKFRVGGNHPWVHLGIAVIMAIGVPLLVLGLGSSAFWIAGLVRTTIRR